MICILLRKLYEVPEVMYCKQCNLKMDENLSSWHMIIFMKNGHKLYRILTEIYFQVFWTFGRTTVIPTVYHHTFCLNSFIAFIGMKCIEHVLYVCCLLVNFENLASRSNMESPLWTEEMLECKWTAKSIFFTLEFSGHFSNFKTESSLITLNSSFYFLLLSWLKVFYV